jgi:hypothetical protein
MYYVWEEYTDCFTYQCREAYSGTHKGHTSRLYPVGVALWPSGSTIIPKSTVSGGSTN